MTTLQQAAQDAAKAVMKHALNRGLLLNEFQVQEDITKHLAPVQAELDRLKREMNEAREIITSLNSDLGCSCEGCKKAIAWLERNK